MKALIACFLFGAAAMTIGGCGGSHVSQGVPNLYQGTWTGTWTGPETNDSGTFALTIDTYGNLTGTMTRVGGLSGTIGGTVTGTGKLTATSTFSSSGNFLINGQVALGSANSVTSLDGNFTYLWNGTLYTGTFATTAGSGK